jgi:hypothetical protein
MKAAAPTTQKRPKLVWAITVFYVVSAISSGFSLYVIFTGAVPLSAARAEYFKSLTVVDHGITIFLSAANLLGAGYLFAMRRQAPYLFTAALAVNVCLSVWQAARNNWLGALSGPGFVGVLIGWAIAFGICVYSWRLLREGVLR